MDTSKTPNSTRIPNLASKIGAICHIFRDIGVFGAFPLAALLGATIWEKQPGSYTVIHI